MTTRPIRIPGEPAANPHDLAREAEIEPAPLARRRHAAPPAPPAEETPEQKIARLEAEVLMLRASDGSRTAPRGVVRHDPADPFAHQRVDAHSREIDPTKLSGKAVLARDGWVVPSFVPEPPVRKVVR